MGGTFCDCVSSRSNLITLLGLTGIGLISSGTHMIFISPVVVGKIPFAFLIGIIFLLVGSVNFVLFLDSICLKKQKKIHAFVAFVALSSGIVNIVYNPREPTICACPNNYYGSDSQGLFMDECKKCDCAGGTCSDTVYGDGKCTCPPRYKQQGGCKTCIDGATGKQCERCKVGWKFEGVTGSCTECYKGYRMHNGQCDHNASGVIEHTCEDGWKTQCIETRLLGIYPPWVNSANISFSCEDDVTVDRTVICDKCEDGHNGRECTQPECVSGDPKTNLPRTISTSESIIPCYDDYDCESFHCVDNRVCGSSVRERNGCNCGLGHSGLQCKPCSNNVVDIGDPCVKGYCEYNFERDEPFCECNTNFEAPVKICTKRLSDGECEPGYWGEECRKCTCLNGVCNDTKTGNGQCQSCYYSEFIFSGIGIWTGDICDKCVETDERDGFKGCGDRCLPTPNFQPCS